MNRRFTRGRFERLRVGLREHLMDLALAGGQHACEPEHDQQAETARPDRDHGDLRGSCFVRARVGALDRCTLGHPCGAYRADAAASKLFAVDLRSARMARARGAMSPRTAPPTLTGLDANRIFAAP